MHIYDEKNSTLNSHMQFKSLKIKQFKFLLKLEQLK